MRVKPAERNKRRLLLVIPLSMTLSSKLVSFPNDFKALKFVIAS